MFKSEQEYLWHRAALLEKRIRDQYGELAVCNIRKFWNDKKEKEYLEELKALWKKQYKAKISREQLIEKNGYLIVKKLFTKNNCQKRQCSCCKKYSFDIGDVFYISKFDCCYRCYIQWVEDREIRWQSGWRPNSK